jgi:sugar diacid utilization regulator
VTSTPAAGDRDQDPAVALRNQLSSLQGLLVLSMRMTESGDERHILRLAGTAVPSLGPTTLHGVFLVDDGWPLAAEPCEDKTVQLDLEAQFAVLSVAGGPVSIPATAWGWAFPLRSLDGHFGYLLVGGDGEPAVGEQFLLRVLAQQTGIALANARMHVRERAIASELRAANTELATTVVRIERSTAIHERLTRVAVVGEGEAGIAKALHELTGYPVAVEDGHGRLRAWAGPTGPPDPYPQGWADLPAATVDRAAADGGAVREGERLIVVANPRPGVFGLLALVDPDKQAGEQEHVALEHGATVLAMELARLHGLAETELRLGRDLVEELLAGADDDVAAARAHALGYDIERVHRVVVVEGSRVVDPDAFFQAARRAARDTGLGSLLMARGGSVVIVSDAEGGWDEFRASLHAETGTRCLVGVGGPCAQPHEVPRSYREARLALRLQASGGGQDTVVFDDLGVFKLLAEPGDAGAVERFAQEWLGRLLDYDRDNKADLVATLTTYLRVGGNHAGAAAALAVHRSTVKYRLQRIREISGHDLAEPETVFNLQLATRAWLTLTSLEGAVSTTPM